MGQVGALARNAHGLAAGEGQSRGWRAAGLCIGPTKQEIYRATLCHRWDVRPRSNWGRRLSNRCGSQGRTHVVVASKVQCSSHSGVSQFPLSHYHGVLRRFSLTGAAPAVGAARGPQNLQALAPSRDGAVPGALLCKPSTQCLAALDSQCRMAATHLQLFCKAGHQACA